MLILLQKKLNELTCPQCHAANSLQVMLNCSMDAKECEPICRCRDCGVRLNLELPEGFHEKLAAHELEIKADLLNATCYLDILEPVKVSEWVRRKAA